MGATWVPDSSFDIAHHVVHATLPQHRASDERHALQLLCGELATTPLDPDRPLWQFHLVDGYEGGSALVARVHHCIGDGIALISVMLSITDGGSDPPKRRKRGSEDNAHEREDQGDWLADAVLKPLSDMMPRFRPLLRLPPTTGAFSVLIKSVIVLNRLSLLLGATVKLSPLAGAPCMSSRIPSKAMACPLT